MRSYFRGFGCISSFLIVQLNESFTLEIARAQGVKPIHSLKDLKLDLSHEELEAYAAT